MGRAKFVPTAEQRILVGVMVACGNPQPEICRGIINPDTGSPIDGKTLRRVFRKELDDGTQIANARVAQSLFTRATGDGPQSVTAAIFWLKTRAGWKEPAESQVTISSEQAAREIRATVAAAMAATAPEHGSDSAE